MTWGWVAGAAIAAVGSVVSSHEQASGQKRAANTQADMFNTINSQEQPFIQAGYGATGTLSELLGLKPGSGEGGTATGTNLPAGYLNTPFDSSNLANAPGYQFSLNQGQQALQSKNAPTVGALSGAALKDLMGFNQGLAQTYYGNYFNQDQTQKQNIFNRLSQIAGLGQSAASQVGNAGTSLGTGIAQAQAAAAASQAGGISSAANTIGNGISLAALLNQQNNPPDNTYNVGKYGGFGGGFGGPDNTLYTDNSGYTYNVPGGS